jgi:hypothetical protein
VASLVRQPSEVRFGRRLLALVAAVLVAFCADDQGAAERSVDCVEAAILGGSTIDHAFPAVGTLAGCTATLVAPDVVLFAAHCVPELAQGCRSPEDAMRGLEFVLAPSGCLEDLSEGGAVVCAGERHAYAIADIAVQPRSYDLEAPSKCPASAPAADRCGTALSFETALYAPFDLALARLRVSRLVSPASRAKPLPVVTSVTDDAPSAYTIHRKIDLRPFTTAQGCARPRGTVVGWGYNERHAMARISGTMDFYSGPAWDEICQPIFTCDAGVADGSCALDGTPGAFAVQALLMHRGSTSPSAFDLEYASTGDSGGPLLVHGGSALGAVPELGDGSFVVGVLSLAAHPPVASRGEDVPALYAATFEPSNARFIEQTLARFAQGASDEDIELDGGLADAAIAHGLAGW